MFLVRDMGRLSSRPDSSVWGLVKAFEKSRFRPTYAGARGTRTELSPRNSLRVRAVVSHISRKTSEMWGTRRSVRG
jgi:hypothetical protein